MACSMASSASSGERYGSPWPGYRDREGLQVLAQVPAVVRDDHGGGAPQQGVTGEHPAALHQHSDGIGGVPGKMDHVPGGAPVTVQHGRQGP